MILVEPHSAYVERILTGPRLQPPKTARLPDDFWAEEVLETLRDYGDEPMRFTSLVNATVRVGNYSRRAEQEAKKRELFRLVGNLIRVGRLDRVGRKYVTIPRSDARYQAYRRALTQTLDLPPPKV